MTELAEMMNLEYYVINNNTYVDQIWLGTYAETIWVYYTDWEYQGGYN